MSQTSSGAQSAINDPVSNVLKWILLAVAVVTFALLVWATVVTYERAPPQPERFVGTNGDAADDGRRYRGRQGRVSEGRPDGLRQPLRHGFLLSDRTTPPATLIRLAGLTEARIAQAQFGKPFDRFRPISRRRFATPCASSCSGSI